jgi:AcrR family transcriptional regulator
MPKRSHLHWIRPARQARSQRNVERLLDAAEELIADKGFDDVTVAEIAARAGLSVGAVYSRFRDKRTLLRCLLDRFTDEAHLTTDATFDPDLWRDASIEEIVNEIILFLVEIHRERRGAVLLLLSGGGGSDAGERKHQLVTHIGECLLVLLLARAERIAHPEPEAAVAFGLRFVLAAIEQAILFDDFAGYGIPTSDDKLAGELSRAFLNYLGVEKNSDAAGVSRR